MIAAGSVITGVSTTGVIAPASDVARTGAVDKENFETGVFVPSVDLKLAMDACAGAFTDDLDSPMYAVTLDPGEREYLYYNDICVKNYGEDTAQVRLRVADVQGSDLTCEPDEGSACGKNGDIVLAVASGHGGAVLLPRASRRRRRGHYPNPPPERNVRNGPASSVPPPRRPPGTSARCAGRSPRGGGRRRRGSSSPGRR